MEIGLNLANFFPFGLIRGVPYMGKRTRLTSGGNQDPTKWRLLPGDLLGASISGPESSVPRSSPDYSHRSE